MPPGSLLHASRQRPCRTSPQASGQPQPLQTPAQRHPRCSQRQCWASGAAPQQHLTGGCLSERCPLQHDCRSDIAAEGRHITSTCRPCRSPHLSAIDHMHHGRCRGATVWLQQIASTELLLDVQDMRNEPSHGLCMLAAWCIFDFGLQVKKVKLYSLAQPEAASAVCRAMSPPEDGRYPVMSMSGPEGCHCTSTSCRACVISTLPSSPTGEGARTPPTCSMSGTAPVRPLSSCQAGEGHAVGK